MMEYRVTIEQNVKYREELIAEFETYDGALAFCKVILENCDKVVCKIERIEDEEVSE